MSDVYAPRGTGKLVETAGAWLLALIWIAPLAYAAWTAFHPRNIRPVSISLRR